MTKKMCHRCGGPNISWYTPSPLWNEVMRGGDIDGAWQFNEIICPTCFCVIAEEKGIAEQWRVHAEKVNVSRWGEYHNNVHLETKDCNVTRAANQ